MVEKTAESNGARAELIIDKGYPITYNDPELTKMMTPTLMEIGGAENVNSSVEATTGAEDFSFFANEVPGLYFRLGGMPKGTKTEDAAPHHTPDFYVDDIGLCTRHQVHEPSGGRLRGVEEIDWALVPQTFPAWSDNI